MVHACFDALKDTHTKQCVRADVLFLDGDCLDVSKDARLADSSIAAIAFSPTRGTVRLWSHQRNSPSVVGFGADFAARRAGGTSHRSGRVSPLGESETHWGWGRWV